MLQRLLRWRVRSAGRLHGKLAILLNALLTVSAAVHGMVEGSAVWYVFSALLAAATGLQIWDRDLLLLGERRVETNDEAADEAPPLESLRDLCEELRLPLQVLGELGDRIPVLEGEARQTAGRALREESQRLVDVVDRWRADRGGEPSESEDEDVRLSELLERVVKSHSSMMQALEVRVRVLTGHERDVCRADRAALLEALGILFSGSLSHLPRGARLEVRTRETAGLWCLSAWGGPCEVSALSAATLDRAREHLLPIGGRVWADPDSRCGFGLSLGRSSQRLRTRPPRVARALEEEVTV